VLLAALNYAKENQVLSTVPHIPMLPLPPRKERYLTRNEAAKLLREARRQKLWHLVMFIRIGLATGARHTAILELTWDRVDLETGRIDFRLPDEVETNKRRRTARLTSSCCVPYARLQEDQPQPCHYLPREPIGLIRKSFLKVAKDAGVKNVSPHTLKHTAITWLLQSGVTPWGVSGLTATSVATITKIYGHHAQSHLKQVVNTPSTPPPCRRGGCLAAT
jgi:integrase